MSDPQDTVERYFAAMRRGADAEQDMRAVFRDDAVYVDPFSGEPRTSVGIEAIIATLRLGWEEPLPDLELDVDEIAVSGSQVVARWTCRSSAWDGPVSGRDTYTVEAGRIARLEVTLDQPGS